MTPEVYWRVAASMIGAFLSFVGWMLFTIYSTVTAGQKEAVDELKVLSAHVAKTNGTVLELQAVVSKNKEISERESNQVQRDMDRMRDRKP